MRKLLIVGVIILFLGLAISPSINANVSKESELVEIKVSNYREDGRAEKTTIKLSKEKASELAKQIRQSDDPEEQFLLHKEYGLIPEDVTREQLRQKMLRVAERLDLTQEKIESIRSRNEYKTDGPDRWFAVNFLNEMVGFTLFSLNLPFGLSLFTGTLNYFFNKYFYKNLLQSIDILYANVFLIGDYRFYNGLLPNFYTSAVCSFILLGFVGYVVSTPFFSFFHYMNGFAVASLVIGPVYLESP